MNSRFLIKKMYMEIISMANW